MRGWAWAKRLYLGLIFLFLYAPILVLVLYSFNYSRSRGNWAGFSLRWYGELFQDRAIMGALGNTVLIALVSALAAAVVGTIAAIGIYNSRGWRKNLLINVTYLPILNPDIVTGISLMLLFIALSFPRGLMSMIVAHITFGLPYVVISVLPKLAQLDPQIFDAALDLGAPPRQAYVKVILPQIMPGVFTGFLLAFTMSVDDFVVSFFVTGDGVSNLAIAIYSMARRGVNPKINAVLTLLFIAVAGGMYLIQRQLNKSAVEL
ncbi:MAG: ABC transporter permease [Peptococcaceae bacterium]|jgi:spermidine/putrescine transport system permease protein|nr:ABC transporter permease [Peptococcaceae bacterium]